MSRERVTAPIVYPQQNLLLAMLPRILAGSGELPDGMKRFSSLDDVAELSEDSSLWLVDQGRGDVHQLELVEGIRSPYLEDGQVEVGPKTNIYVGSYSAGEESVDFSVASEISRVILPQVGAANYGIVIYLPPKSKRFI